ncbi:MAG: DUF6691 family protein [Pseudomonadales bacterium]
MKALFALLAGTLFGLGLAISGMANPSNVIAFLNLSPDWQPALMFVMGSALLVTFLGYRLLGQRHAPLFDERFHTPSNTHIDIRLLSGSALFGVGWGLSGYCPGPAIVGAWTLDERALMFLGAFLLGNLIFDLIPAAQKPSELSTIAAASDG